MSANKAKEFINNAQVYAYQTINTQKQWLYLENIEVGNDIYCIVIQR